MEIKSSKSRKKIVVQFFFYMLLILSIIILIVFIITFWGPISHDLTDWYEYGSFLAFIVSLVNLACFVSLTYNASVFQENSHYKQMLAQKMELQTTFRKSHIDEIRRQMLELNQLPVIKLNDEKSFIEFMIRCKSLIRIFAIYETNHSSLMFGNCNYKTINSYFSELNDLLDQIYNSRNLPSNEDKKILNEIFSSINIEMIKLEKELSDYALQEVINAFE